MRRLRGHACRLQLAPQSPLPEVSRSGASRLARRPPSRAAADPYFHVVITLPPAAAEIAFHNKAPVYALLIRAAEALMTLAANAKWLGARIGLLAVLHTWRQMLTHHPYVHCVVPGGGVALDGKS